MMRGRGAGGGAGRNQCHRSQLEIIYAIIQFLYNSRKPASKLALMYGIGTSFTALKSYMEFLEERDLIRVEDLDYGHKAIYLTEKGIQLAEKYRDFHELYQLEFDLGFIE